MYKYLLIFLFCFSSVCYGDTLIFSDDCAGINANLTDSSPETGTAWSSKVNLQGTPVNIDTDGVCAAASDNGNEGAGYRMSPNPTTDAYYIRFIWGDAGPVAVSETVGCLLNWATDDTYYHIMFNDDSTPDIFITRNNGTPARIVDGGCDVTDITNGEEVECKIDYSGSDPILTITNITDSTELCTHTDSAAGKLSKAAGAGISSGGDPEYANRDQEDNLSMDDIKLYEVGDAGLLPRRAPIYSYLMEADKYAR